MDDLSPLRKKNLGTRYNLRDTPGRRKLEMAGDGQQEREEQQRQQQDNIGNGRQQQHHGQQLQLYGFIEKARGKVNKVRKALRALLSAIHLNTWFCFFSILAWTYAVYSLVGPQIIDNVICLTVWAHEVNAVTSHDEGEDYSQWTTGATTYMRRFGVVIGVQGMVVWRMRSVRNLPLRLFMARVLCLEFSGILVTRALVFYEARATTAGVPVSLVVDLVCLLAFAYYGFLRPEKPVPRMLHKLA